MDRWANEDFSFSNVYYYSAIGEYESGKILFLKI